MSTRCNKCEECECMKIMGRPFTRVTESPVRGHCYCQHPEAEAALALMFPDDKDKTPFIGYTKPGKDKVDKNPLPNWCPKRLEEEPKEINKAAAYKVCSSHHPRGLFYIKEDTVYAGIDSTGKEVLVEEFESQDLCVDWLKTHGGVAVSA